MNLPNFEAAESMCEMWGHPVDADGWCACGEVHPTSEEAAIVSSPPVTTPSQEGRPEMERAFTEALRSDHWPYTIQTNDPERRGEITCSCGWEHSGQLGDPVDWAAHIAAALAAVVVSSHATPARHPGDEANPAIDALRASSDRIAAASPATPNGQGERAGHQHSWEGSAGAAYDYCLHCRVMRHAPSPASPAETAEPKENEMPATPMTARESLTVYRHAHSQDVDPSTDYLARAIEEILERLDALESKP